MSDGRLTGMPVLGLLYPSFVLAAEADPSQWADDRSRIADADARRTSSSERAMCASGCSTTSRRTRRVDGRGDQRWYWAAPILLDLERDAASARAWFGQANLAAQWRGAGGDAPTRTRR